MVLILVAREVSMLWVQIHEYKYRKQVKQKAGESHVYSLQVLPKTIDFGKKNSLFDQGLMENVRSFALAFQPSGTKSLTTVTELSD